MDSFTTQPIGTPSLDASTRDKIAPTPPAGGGPAFTPESSGGSFWSRNKWFAIILALAVLVIVVLGFFALRKPSGTKESKVNLEMVVPAEVPSSTEAVVKAVITNNDSTAISGGELELIYPNGVVFVSSTPPAENLSGTLFKVPDLTPGTNLAVVVKLKFQGGVGEDRTIQGKLKYNVQGISADFNKEAKGTARLVAAGVSLDVQGPQTATNAQLLTYTIHYSNGSSQGFERVRVKATFPQSFQFADSNPPASQGKDTWDIPSLPPGSQGDITVSGTFISTTPGQSIPIAAQLLVPDKNGGFYTQAESRFTTAISNQPLMVSQTLQNAASSEGVARANPGDTLQYRISFQNNASTAARGVRIVYTVDSTTADLATVQAEGAVVNGNTVTWSAASSPELEVLNPNESGSVSVTVRIKDPPVKDRSINPDLVTNVKIKADEYDTFLPGNKLQVKIATAFQMDVVPAYLDGQRPPKVGQESRFTVSVSLKSSTSDVTDGIVTLFMAAGSASFDKSSLTPAEADKVTFDSSTGKLVWRLGTLRAHTGDFTPPRTLQFTLRIVPSSGQAGRPLSLVRNVQFTGKDANAEKDITASKAELTTGDIAGGGTDTIVIP